MAPIRPWPWLLAALALPVAVMARGARSDEPPASPPPHPRLVPQLGHSHWVSAAWLSADGRWVLTWGLDATARLWERDGGREVRTYLLEPAGQGKPLAFAPDGLWFVTNDKQRRAHLWDCRSGVVTRALGPASAAGPGVRCAAFPPAGREVVTGEADGQVVAWSLDTGGALRRYAGLTKDVLGLAFSADGRRLAAGEAGGQVRVWDVEGGRLVGALATGVESLPGLALSSDGEPVVTNEGTQARWLASRGGTELRTAGSCRRTPWAASPPRRSRETAGGC